MMEKVCLTTYVYGIKYQNYIPFLVYSCHKSYPEYDIVLFLYERMDVQIKKQLELLNVDNLRIIEDCFRDCPKMNALKAKSLRWVLWDNSFMMYDFIYVVDIDMLYIKEPMPLHIQHKEHMKTTGLCFDNMRRLAVRNPFKISSLGQRLKHAGFQSVFSYLFSNHVEYKLSGLHFIKTEPYYSIFSQEIRNKYKQAIYNGSYLRLFMMPNNEVFLYKIMKDTFENVDAIGIQTDSVSSLSFENPNRLEFRPHHGIHLGIFRGKIGANNTILDSAVYHYYLDIFIKDYLHDDQFTLIYGKAPDFIRNHFNSMFDYYNIRFDSVKCKLL